MLEFIVSRFRRPPDFIVGGAISPYLMRWWLIPRNRWFNVYLHKFVRDDEDRALHDHPWPSLSIVLAGGYYDIHEGPDKSLVRRWYGPGSIVIRKATSAHRVELATSWHPDRNSPIEAWTLFITGPTVREWGFHCPQGWRHWREFVDNRDEGAIGKGCD